MILKTQTSYPQARSFVLKLHRDAAPADGRLIGRLEHVASGRQFDFHTAEELIACLARGADATASSEPQARAAAEELRK
jgi:hypothetical protein